MLKANHVYAFETYIDWLKNYPHDYKGATDAASDFIDDLDDFEKFEAMLSELKNN